jgi:nucleoside-diphosphate-sugar epimerase
MSIDLHSARVLVIGGSGFIGSHLTRRLLLMGCEVIATGRSPQSLLGLPIRFFELPLHDTNRFAQLVQELRPDITFHLAARTTRDRDPSLLLSMLKENTLPVAALCEALCMQPKAKLVVVCSAEDYGSIPGPWEESMREKPSSPYGLSKLLAGTLAIFSSSFGLHTAVARPSIVYGPRQRPGMFIPSLIVACKNNESFSMTKGEQLRDFLYVDDAVDGLLALLSPVASGKVFNLSTGISFRIVDVAKKIQQSIGLGELVVGALPYRPNEAMAQEMNPSLAQRLLGWAAGVSLEKGLVLTIDSY